MHELVADEAGCGVLGVSDARPTDSVGICALLAQFKGVDPGNPDGN